MPTTDPALAAHVTADHHNLPTGRTTSIDGVAHVFTAHIDDLHAWLTALGGHTTHQPAGRDVTLWTLHTHTEPYANGTRTPIRVHALALRYESIDADIRTAAAHSPAA